MDYNIIGIIINCLVFGLLGLGVLMGLWRGLRKSALRLIWLAVSMVVLLFISVAITRVVININFGFLKIDGFTTISEYVTKQLVDATSQYGVTQETLQQGVQLSIMLVNPIVYILLFTICRYVLLPLNFAVYKAIYGRRERRDKKALKEWKKNQKHYTKDVELAEISKETDSTDKLKKKLDIIDIKQKPKVMKKQRLLGACVGLICGYVVVIGTVSPILGMLETVKRIDSHKAYVITKDENETRGYIEYLTNGEYSLVNDTLNKNAGMLTLKYTGANAIGALSFRRLTSLNTSVNGTKYRICLSDDIDRITDTIDTMKPVILGKLQKPYNQVDLKNYISAIDTMIGELRNINTVSAFGDILMPVAVNYIEDKKLINTGDTMLDNIIYKVLKNMPAEAVNMNGVYDELRCVLNAVKALNDADLLAPLINGEIKSYQLQGTQKSGFDAYVRALNSPVMGSSNNVLTYCIDSLLNMKTAVAVLPDIVDYGLNMLDKSLDYGYTKNEHLTVEATKNDIRSLIVSAFDAYVNFDYSAVTISSAGQTEITNTLTKIGKVLDIAKNSQILNEHISDSSYDYINTNYYKLLNKFQTKIIESFVEKSVPENLRADVRCCVQSMTNVSSWENEIGHISKAIDSIFPYFIEVGSGIKLKSINTILNKDLVNKMLDDTDNKLESRVKELFNELSKTTMFSVKTKITEADTNEVPVYASIIYHCMDKIQASLTTKIKLDDTFVAVKENIKNTTYNFEFGDEISKVVPLVKVVRNTYNTNKDRELSSTDVSTMLKTISSTMVGEENVVDRAGDMFLLKGEPIKKALHSALDYFTSGEEPIVNINSAVLDELKTAITNINNAEKWNYAVKWSSELNGIAEIVGILQTGTSGMTGGSDITAKINSAVTTGTTLDQLALGIYDTNKPVGERYRSQIITSSVVRTLLADSVNNAKEKDATGAVITDSSINKALSNISDKLTAKETVEGVERYKVLDKDPSLSDIENATRLSFTNELCAFTTLLHCKSNINIDNIVSTGKYLDKVLGGGQIGDTTLSPSVLIDRDDVRNIIVDNIYKIKISSPKSDSIEECINTAIGEKTDTAGTSILGNLAYESLNLKDLKWENEFNYLKVLYDSKNLSNITTEKDNAKDDTIRVLGGNLSEATTNTKSLNNYIIKPVIVKALLEIVKKDKIDISDADIKTTMQNVVAKIATNLKNYPSDGTEEEKIDTLNADTKLFSREFGYLQDLYNLKDKLSKDANGIFNLNEVLGQMTATAGDNNSGIGGVLDNIVNNHDPSNKSKLITHAQIDSILHTVLDKNMNIPSNTKQMGIDISGIKTNVLNRIEAKSIKTKSYKTELHTARYILDNIINSKNASGEYINYTDVKNFESLGKKFDKTTSSVFFGFVGKDILLKAVDGINAEAFGNSKENPNLIATEDITAIKTLVINNVDSKVKPYDETTLIKIDGAYGSAYTNVYYLVENCKGIVNSRIIIDSAEHKIDFSLVKDGNVKVDNYLTNIQNNALAGSAVARIIARRTLLNIKETINSQKTIFADTGELENAITSVCEDSNGYIDKYVAMLETGCGKVDGTSDLDLSKMSNDLVNYNGTLSTGSTALNYTTWTNNGWGSISIEDTKYAFPMQSIVNILSLVKN